MVCHVCVGGTGGRLAGIGGGVSVAGDVNFGLGLKIVIQRSCQYRYTRCLQDGTEKNNTAEGKL